MTCHTPPLKKAKQQGEMPLPILLPIPFVNCRTVILQTAKYIIGQCTSHAPSPTPLFHSTLSPLYPITLFTLSPSPSPITLFTLSPSPFPFHPITLPPSLLHPITFPPFPFSPYHPPSFLSLSSAQPPLLPYHPTPVQV